MNGPGAALPAPSLSGPAGPPEPVDTLTAPVLPRPEHRATARLGERPSRSRMGLGYLGPMDGEELREIQRPLKDEYRANPQGATVTLSAEGRLADTEVACSVQTGRALVEAGLHPATGGDGSLACSGDMLLQALVACAGVTLRSVATSRDIDVTGTVRAEGDLDFRGTLGVDREAPVGFRSIRLTFDLRSDAPKEDLDRLVATTERYCVVLRTLASSPALEVSRTDS
jgi:uncharacterized OsmC-like protein